MIEQSGINVEPALIIAPVAIGGFVHLVTGIGVITEKNERGIGGGAQPEASGY